MQEGLSSGMKKYLIENIRVKITEQKYSHEKISGDKKIQS